MINTGGSTLIQNPRSEQRVYAGVRAQRIRPSDALLPVADRHPISVAAPLWVQENVLVQDIEAFVIDVTKVQPTPQPIAPATFPAATGNLMLGSDLFLKGDLYKSEGGKWLSLKEYFKQLVPDIQVGTKTLPVAPTTSITATGNLAFTLTSSLSNPSKAEMIAALYGIEWQTKPDLDTWATTIPAQPITLEVSASTPVKQAGSNNVYDVFLNWGVGPKDSPTTPMLNVKSLKVGYVAVFYP